MSQNRSSAVMQQRARRVVVADDTQRQKWRDLDFFPTPPWAARAGAELVKRVDPMAACVWEPACGEGHISEPIREIFPIVYTSDIHRYNGAAVHVMDFLDGGISLAETLGHDRPDWIITNPPFLKAAEFVQRGLEVAMRGVAVLCRAAFLESATRFPLLFEGDYPLTIMAPFIERVPMQLGSWDPAASTATAYAWFLFRKVGRGPQPIIIPIPPGTKARLTKVDDAARFGATLAMPLFEGETHDS